LFLAIFTGVFAAIIALGIVVVGIWKCVAIRKEKLEFMKFKNEQEKSQWESVSNFCLFILYVHMHAYLSH
jgi:hypothetical protein